MGSRSLISVDYILVAGKIRSKTHPNKQVGSAHDNGELGGSFEQLCNIDGIGNVIRRGSTARK